jgi:polyisoprenoid-binding protein YceI
MRTVIPALFLAFLLEGAAATYRIQPAPDSSFTLEVYKTGLWSGRKHVFRFERYRGEVQYDPEHPQNSRARFVVESSSAVCKDDWVKASDQKKVLAYTLDEMLAASKYPEIAFESVSIAAQSGEHFQAQGNLTVRGITKPVTIDLTVKTARPDRIQLEGTAEIRLKDYGLKPPSAALGTIGTKNEMLLRFVLFAVR